jgi:hypothetical protein
MWFENLKICEQLQIETKPPKALFIVCAQSLPLSGLRRDWGTPAAHNFLLSHCKNYFEYFMPPHLA